jgi:prepilin-type N-terminal cleavage/methylation domain-containing protein
MNKFKKGFTMIELLVVIAVIGVLAVAVLSAINPIEQINKGRDTGRRSDAGEVLGAIERYYASIGWYPWEIISNNPPTGVVVLTNIDALMDVAAAPISVLTKMVNTNEIKEGLKSRLTALGATDKVKVYFAGSSTAGVYACFLPKSKAFQTEAATRCAVAANWGTDSPFSLGATGPCPASCTVLVPATCMICLP